MNFYECCDLTKKVYLMLHRVDILLVYYVYFQRYLEKYKNVLVDYFEFFYTVGVEFF